ncbi:MAG: glycosyltransferase family 2 protein [Pseudomonadota bacterium]
MSIASIAVLIINYKTAQLTIKAVDSVLERGHGQRHIYIHVIDNASPDDSAIVLQAAYTERGWGGRVTLHMEDYNHGFGRGNNLVLRELVSGVRAPDAIFFLNPDAFLQNEAIDLLANALETNAKAGFAGAGIAKPNGQPVAAAFQFPSVISEFSSALNFGPVARLFAKWQVPLKPDTAAGQVDWVSGAAVLARLKTLAEVDFFDPQFFLYYEEVDLMRRALDQGWHCLYIPEARVAHVEGEATGVKSGQKFVARVPGYRYESWQYYFRKTHGRPVALLVALATIIGSAGNKIISTLRRRPSSVPSHFFRDFWTHALRPLLFGAS